MAYFPLLLFRIYLIQSPSPLTVIHIPEWFPGARYKRAASYWHRVVDSALQAPYDKVKSELVSFRKCLSGHHTVSEFPYISLRLPEPPLRLLRRTC
jgi:hypothetical protein